jgi:ligand-binding sensor domain-containing protein/signal transduction histidine kinase
VIHAAISSAGRPLVKRLATFALLLAGLLCASPPAWALATAKPLKQYGRQSWQSDTGLPQNTVHAIVQTRDGYLWVATEGGLVRFDGQELRTFDPGNTPQLTSASINDLALDEQGTLWISTGSGLVARAGGRFTALTTANGLPSDVVRFVYPRVGGGVVAITANGLALGDAAGFHALSAIPSEITPEQIAEDGAGTLMIASGQQIFSIRLGSTAVSSQTLAEAGDIQAIAAAGATGDLWVGSRNGLFLLHNGRPVPMNSGAGHLNATALLATPNGGLLIGTDSGLLEYAHGALKRLGEKTGVTSGRVLRLHRDREGSVWVAYDLGVSRITPEMPEQLQAPLDIPGVLSIFEDREGDMWFGTDVGGATVLREQAFSTLTTQDGLSDDFIRSVFQDRAGTIWLGTNRGGLDRIAQGRITAIRAAAGEPGASLSSNVVLALAESGGDLWIGTPDGLNRLRNGQLKLFTTADGLPDDFVRSLYTDADGSLWIGTRNGLSHYQHGAFTSYSRLDGLGGDLIGGILRTRDGTLWVGTLNGLSRLDGTAFKNFTTRDGLGSDAITNLAEDREGTLWIASHAAGLTRLRNGVFSALASAKAGLPEEIYSVLEDRKTRPSLWLGSSKGVFRVPLDGLNAFADHRSAILAIESFGTADGMKISECSSGGHPAAWRMSDGSLWFATLKGAASIDPASEYENPIAPLTAIEDVTIDDQPASLGQAIVLLPGRERISVHYAGLGFRAPQKLRFRYKLEGFDRDWIYAGARRTAFYTNVPAGTYRFLVYSSNGDGVWSEVPGEISFTVRPHFYQTIWFYCVALLIAALLAYAIYRARVRAVESQYRAVLAERNRIAREIHDTLAQGYVGISVQLEVASRLLQGSKEAAAQQLENTKEYVRASLAEARSSIWNLRSAESGAASETLPARLAAAIKSRQTSAAGAPALRFDVHGTFRPLDRRDRRVEDEILKIAQEAINNALRHASASAIAVVLSYDTDWLRLSIADDGKGFDPSAVANGHYGLQGMRERAAGIGAHLEIHGTLPAGTVVELSYQMTGRKASQ